MTIRELFQAIGDVPVLAAGIFLVGVPIIAWFYRAEIGRLIYGKK